MFNPFKKKEAAPEPWPVSDPLEGDPVTASDIQPVGTAAQPQPIAPYPRDAQWDNSFSPPPEVQVQPWVRGFSRIDTV
jgi:hypothetical protein